MPSPTLRRRTLRRSSLGVGLLSLALLLPSLPPAYAAPAAVNSAIAAPITGEPQGDEPHKALDLPYVDLGDSYIADGVSVPLVRRTDQLVVALRDGASLARVTAPGQALAGFVAERSLADEVVVLDNSRLTTAGPQPQATLQQLNTTASSAEQRSDVAWVAPVFVDPASGHSLVVADEVIVALTSGLAADELPAAFPAITTVRPLAGTPDQFVVTVAAGGGEPALALAAQLSGDPRVAWAVPNFYQEFQRAALDDPLLPQQWHLRNTGQFNGLVDADADVVEAWEVVPGGSPSVVVAVIDDGVENSHPDLIANRWVNQGEIANNGRDDDGNGWVDDINGWDFTSNDNSPTPGSVNNDHGTALAGVIAARDNGIGVVGVAYRTRYMSVRIFGENASPASDANIASAIYYAAGRTADGTGTWNAAAILNNSWVGGLPSPAITTALTWAGQNGRGGRGAVSFFAAGNSGNVAISYPANLSGTVPGVVAVGASTNQDERAFNSQTGPQLDLLAPSGGPSSGGTYGIVTVDRQGTSGFNAAAGSAGDYTDTLLSSYTGTSASTSMATGIGALLLARDPNLSAGQVRELMRATADLIGPESYPNGRNNRYGFGRVNANSAVRGVGVAEVNVLDDRRFYPSGSTIELSARPGVEQLRQFRIRNQGTQPLTLSDLAISGDGAFSISAGLSATTLALGEVATFSVRFAPTSVTRQTATVRFTSNDSDEGSYTLTLLSEAQSVGGVVYEDRNGDGILDRDDLRLAGRQLFLDLDNNGTPQEHVGGGTVNLAIPDADPAGATSALSISGGGSISSLAVTVNITHPRLRDLNVALVSPAGTVVPLFNQRSGVNLTSTTFSDDAPTSIVGAGAPFTGSFRPERPLAAFHGESAQGSWRLRVVDTLGAETGTLVSWSLRLSTEPMILSGEDGSYAFSGLSAGSYIVRQVPVAGWTFTQPSSGFHSVAVNGSSANLGRDFAQQRPGVIYGFAYEDWDGNGSRSSDEPGLPSRQIIVDSNNNDQLDRTTFNVAANTAIPDATPAGITSSALVSGISAPVGEVRVGVQITHSFVGDLSIELISPAGTRVVLVSRRGGSGDNFTSTMFDDAGATAIAAGTAPFTGSFRPEVPLSTFNGEAANGTWQLRVRDDQVRDVGTLVSWSLSLNSEPTDTSDSSGYYELVLPAGGYPLEMLPTSGWTRIEPTSGIQNASATGAPGLRQAYNFGEQRQNTIYGKAFEDRDGDGVLDPGEPGIAGRQIVRDINNNGVLDAPISYNRAPNLAIPDNNAAGVNDTLAVVGFADPIFAVTVRVRITHAFVNDLALQLVSPAGTAVPLITRRGGSGDNFTDTVLDDTAAAAISSVSPADAPFSGRYRPESPLAALRGQPANGDWQLQVADRASPDTGVLVEWSLEISSEPITLSDANGNYRFSDVPAGDHRIVQGVPPVGWYLSAPTGGVHAVTLTSGATASGRNFANVPDSTPPLATLGPVTPNPRNSAVTSVAIGFDEPVSGLSADRFSLRRDGVPLSLSGAILTGSGTSYQLSGLGDLTAAAGEYTLTLSAGVIRDRANNELAAPVSTSWTVDTSGPTATIVPIAGGTSQRFTVSFNEPIAAASFTADDLTVSGPAVGSGTAATISGSGSSFVVTVNGLQAGGVLSLTLRAGTVSDLAGNTNATAATASTTTRFTVMLPLLRR